MQRATMAVVAWCLWNGSRIRTAIWACIGAPLGASNAPQTRIEIFQVSSRSLLALDAFPACRVLQQLETTQHAPYVRPEHPLVLTSVIHASPGDSAILLVRPFVQTVGLVSINRLLTNQTVFYRLLVSFHHRTAPPSSHAQVDLWRHPQG